MEWIKGLLKTAYKDIVTVVCMWTAVTLLLIFFLGLDQCDLSVPISYGGGDELSIINTARMVQESGWNIGTDRLSASDDYYYNNNEIISGLHNADIILVSFFLMIGGNDVFWASNMTYLAIFYIASLVTYIVLRTLGVKKWLSLGGALVYAFLPFVFMRGVGHLSLSSHYFVPLAVLMAVWVYEDKKFMLPGKDFFKYKRNIAGFIMALLVATQGIGYWQVFGCFVIMVASISAFIKSRDLKSLIRGFVAIGSIVLAVLACCIPVFVSMINGGSMAASGRARYGSDGEVFGLKIVQLLLPVNGHGIDSWQYCIDMYNAKMPLVNENKTAYLGLFGIMGFFVLCFWLLTGKKDASDYRNRMTVLSEINICCVALATVGGIGSILYLAGFTLLRSYNRISVYIACVAIIGGCMFIQECLEYIKKAVVKTVISGVVILFMLFAIWEQNPGSRVDFAGNKSVWESDRDFVSEVDNIMDEDGKVFQLPYVSFPEAAVMKDMAPLEHLTGFLHSDKLRWSYGTMPESNSDKWYQETAKLRGHALVSELSDKGYDGVYINRSAYDEDEWKNIEETLRKELGVEPVVSRDGRLSFFKMR